MYVYDNRDRITKVSSTNLTVTYAWDGDGNLKQRSDATGITKYDFDPLNRETIRTLQDGSQTVLEYTPEGNVESYTDPSGTVEYTYSKTHNLLSLTDPQGKKTTYDYNANDARTKTSLPAGITETITRDKSNRATRITATSEAEGTMIDLAYSYAYTSGGETVDGTQIRTRTDAVDGLKRTYDYDSAGRLKYAKETEGSTLNNSWLYCYDKAGNLTSQNGNLPAARKARAEDTCPGGSAYTYNDASQLTAVNGDTSGWSYDKTGNETAARPTGETARTSTWNDLSQLTDITQGGQDYKGRYASTDQSERTQFGGILFHNGPVGMSAQTSGGVDMNFTREPSGNLHSFRTNKPGSEGTYYYLTDGLGTVEAVVDSQGEKVNWYYYSPNGITSATERVSQPYRYAGGYQDPTGLYHNEARYYDPNVGRFTQPDPAGLEANPYLYASGDPANLMDPNGTWGIPKWAKNTWKKHSGAIIGIGVAAGCSFASGMTATAACVIIGSGVAGAVAHHASGKNQTVGGYWSATWQPMAWGLAGSFAGKLGPTVNRWRADRNLPL